MPPMCQAALCLAIYIYYISKSSLRPREVKMLTPSYSASKWQSKDLNLSDSKAQAFSYYAILLPQYDYSPLPPLTNGTRLQQILDS